MRVYCHKTLGNKETKSSHSTSGENFSGIQRLEIFKRRATVFKQQRLDKDGMFLQPATASLKVSYEVPS